jgi:hypothetical protein
MPGDREYQRAAAFSSQLCQAHQHLKAPLPSPEAALGRPSIHFLYQTQAFSC